MLLTWDTELAGRTSWLSPRQQATSCNSG